MRPVLSTILLGVLLIQFNAGPILWVSYYLNADRIAEEYCMNRRSPSCHGKCHMKEMQDEQESRQPPAETRRQFSEPLFFAAIVSSNFLLQDQGDVPPLHRDGTISSGFLDALFHPPRTARS